MAETASDLMRKAMENNGIGWGELLAKSKELAIEETDRNFERFSAGGAVSITIAAAIVTLIVQKKGRSRG